MNFSKTASFPLFALMMFGVFACGSEEPDTDTDNDDSEENPDGGGDGDTDVDPADFYPMSVGAYWVYEETTSAGSVELTYTVTGQETEEILNVGEKEVFIVENTFDSMNERRIQFIGDDGTRSVRWGHEVYDETDALTKTRYYNPGFLRFDRDRITAGETWSETVTRVTDTLDDESDALTEEITYDFEILNVGTALTLEIGTFNCIQIKRQSQADGEIKYYWYAPGVGKVQELTGDKSEILVDSSYLN